MIIRPVGAELLHAEERTNMRLIVAFRNFANALKTSTVLSYQTVSVKWHNALVKCMQLYLCHGTTQLLQTMYV
jgi:hypothetical protein